MRSERNRGLCAWFLAVTALTGTLLAISGVSMAAATVAAAPSVSVVPAVGLRSGERVDVELHGFSAGEKVWVSECALRRDVEADGCGKELPEQPFAVTTNHGRGGLKFVVRARAATTAAGRTGSPVYVDCAACVLVATEGRDLDHPRRSTILAEAPLSFDHGSLPFTGLPVERLAFLGIGVIGVGTLLTLVGSGRRRRPRGA
jgi:Neocarzinostatin family